MADIPFTYGHRRRADAAALKLALEDGELGLTEDGLALMKKYGLEEFLSLNRANEFNADGYASFSAAVTSIGGATATLLVTSQQAIPASVAVPSNIRVVAAPNAFSVATGQTLTINGPFEAGDYQVFSGAGIVAGLKVRNVMWFGATNNGVDSTTAILNCSTGGYSVWAAGQVISGAGIYRYFRANLYVSTGAGTTGPSAPKHTAGSVTDGAVTWTYVSALGSCIFHIPYGVKFTRKTLTASLPTHVLGLDMSMINDFSALGETAKKIGILSSDQAENDTHAAIDSGHHAIATLNNHRTAGTQSADEAKVTLLWAAGQFDLGLATKLGFRGAALHQFTRETGGQFGKETTRWIAPWVSIGGIHMAWEAGQAITGAGIRRSFCGRTYTSTGAGTTGSTAPTHTTGSVSDGAVTWTYEGLQRPYEIWEAGQAVTVGDFRFGAISIYVAASTGTTGATSPTHTAGTQTDGGVLWTWVDISDRTVWSIDEYNRFMLGAGSGNESISSTPGITDLGGSYLSWGPGQSISGAGIYRRWGNRLYVSTGAGTTGANPPIHRMGSASDGTVTWTHVGTSGIYTEWEAGQVIAIGDSRRCDDRLYWATSAGTTGGTPPVHTSGSASDGAVTWLYVNPASPSATVTAWAAGQAIGGAGVSRRNAGLLYVSEGAGTTGASAPTHASGSVSDGAVTWTYVGAIVSNYNGADGVVNFAARGLNKVAVLKLSPTNGVGEAVQSVPYWRASRETGLAAQKSDGSTYLAYFNDETGFTVRTLVKQSGSAANGDTTPSVVGVSTLYVTNAGATSITALDDGVDDQEIDLIFTNGNTTLIHSATLTLQGSINVTPTAWSSIRFRKTKASVDGRWIEAGRSIK